MQECTKEATSRDIMHIKLNLVIWCIVGVRPKESIFSKLFMLL